MFGDVPSSMPVQSIAQGASDCKRFPPCGGKYLLLRYLNMIKTPWSTFQQEAAEPSQKDNTPTKGKVDGGPRSASRPSDTVSKEAHMKANYDGTYTVTDSDGVDFHHDNHADAIEHMSSATKPASEGDGPATRQPATKENLNQDKSHGSKVSTHGKIEGDIAR